ncbi:MAG: hypothetical protein KAX11_10175 [Candidatus Aminicenantes bacterium]|nr:hypothetical protein [Candidatus Aminicenantes bacterium]
MKKIIILVFIFILGSFGFLSAVNGPTLWKEFVTSLYKNEMSLEQIKSSIATKEQLMEWLNIMKSRHTFEEMISDPEIFVVENKIHFLKALTYKDQKVTYNFSFIIEDNKWYFFSLETILIRLDKMPPLPTGLFPDIPGEQKAWKREEILISKQVRLWNFFAEEKGKEAACNWFKDGYGFLVAATQHVPFVPQYRAFILYLCWYQANLWGNPTKLVKLEENEAVVEMQSFFLLLYERASHLKTQISRQDYYRLFETIWKDRAEKAGWTFDIQYSKDENGTCVFHFRRGGN